MNDPSKENQQFEEVLSRLDALMRRSHPGTAMPPAYTPPPPTEPAASEINDAGNPELLFVLEEVTEIPVLTEVYDGTLPPTERRPSHELAEAFIDALMPLMLDNLDLIVAEEAARMQQNIAERLRLEIGEALRQRLQQKG